jgi:MoCo/4Fe-4S cofactor protein with predicted Tat translocation signal
MNKQWRSIEDLNNSKEVEKFKYREFQEGASELGEGVSRRDFLKFLGSTAALAGLSGCNIRKPYYKIKPYAKKLEHVVPGTPTFYATSYQLNSAVYGVLVETHEGRPTKIEGNPLYPESNGSSLLYQQSSVIDLYDPDRLKSPKNLTKSETIDEFKDSMLGLKDKFLKSKGNGLVFLIEDVLSPTTYALIDSILSRMPEAKFYRYESYNNDNQRFGLKDLTNQFLNTKFDLTRSNVIVSFSDDFLSFGQHQIQYSREFSDRRDPDSDIDLNRLYSFEERFTVTGSKADHRYPVKQSDIAEVLSQLLILVARKVGFNDLDRYANVSYKPVELDFIDHNTLTIIADDLIANRRRSLITAGSHLDSSIHQLVFLINSILGNNFNTVFYQAMPFLNYGFNKVSSIDSISNLVDDLNSNKVDTILILGGNPVYSAPNSLGLKRALSKAVNRIHLTYYDNETSKLCNWVVPRLHYLESWNDLESSDGVVSIAQPVIHRTVEGLTDHEFLNLVFRVYRSDYSLVKNSWNFLSSEQFDKVIHDGFYTKKNILTYPSITKVNPIQTKTAVSSNHELEVTLYPDYKILDGRFSNNGWLQEMPDPIHKLTWDNAAYIAPKTAKRLGLVTGDVVRLQSNGSDLEIPVFISPGHAIDAISISMGYGKQLGHRIEDGVGFNAFNLFDTDFIVSNVTLINTGEKHTFATTQDHGSMEGRPHVRYATVSEYNQNPTFAQGMEEVPHNESLWKNHEYNTGYQWGMVIDLTRCTSCNACTASCQAENNIPIVGKDQVLNGREMQWLRTDRYYEGNEDNPKILDQPVACLHCENAPCEQVCPVAATVHDDEGLNVMVYNRCVGTRYCSDNCPVKVRRFNFFDYHQRNPQSVDKKRFHLFDYIKEPDKSIAKQFNPDVTVRMRGIMEKCTYCIQRIKSATIKASNEDRSVKDADLKTACQQACPTDGIAFGNILDENSQVFKWRKKQRNYSILEQLLLGARTTYLANVFNPNELLVATNSSGKKEHHGNKH